MRSYSSIAVDYYFPVGVRCRYESAVGLQVATAGDCPTMKLLRKMWASLGQGRPGMASTFRACPEPYRESVLMWRLAPLSRS